jgi:hypothetical protein
METLLSAQAVWYVGALLLVIVLIIAVLWLVRRFGPSALSSTAAARGRQPRLAVIEFAQVGDGRRRLMLIRRDNIEHLVMTGGPTDVVIEQNIVRAAPAAPGREVQPSRVSDALPRPVPLADAGTWQPEPAVRAPRPPAPALAMDDEEPAWSPRPEPQSAPRVPAIGAERSTGPANDISRGFQEVEPIAPPRRAAEPRRTPPPPPTPAITESEEQNLAEMAQRIETALHRPRPAEAPPAVPAPRSAPVAEVRAEPRAEPRAELRVEPRPEPRTEPRAEPRPEPRPDPRAEPRPEPRAEPRAEPKAEPRPPVPVRTEVRTLRAEPKPSPKPAPKPAPAPAPKAAFDSLEQEMASLLGRPSGKT